MPIYIEPVFFLLSFEVIECFNHSNLVSFFFLGPHCDICKFPRLEVESELQLPAYTTPDPSLICDTTAHGNARSLSHWVRPGIEPESSWILVRFVNHWATMGTPWKALLMDVFARDSTTYLCHYISFVTGYLSCKDWSIGSYVFSYFLK